MDRDHATKLMRQLLRRAVAQRLCYEEALRNADSKNELRLRIKLESRRNQDSTHSMQNLTLLAEEPDHA
jgi:Tfp pilus assembly ATPase PilU